MSMTEKDEAVILVQLRMGRLIRGEVVNIAHTDYKLDEDGALRYRYKGKWVYSQISAEEFLRECQQRPEQKS